MAKGVYKLNPQQMGSYQTLRTRGRKNQEQMVARAVAFIQEQLGFDPESGSCVRKAVIGVSGGVDSAVVLALAVRAVGNRNVIAVKMPYFGVSSSESLDYADLLTREFKVDRVYQVVINEAVDAEVAALGRGGIRVSRMSKGNIMARLRMTSLYAIANEFGGMVLDTCNLTEIKMGYLTKFGDGASDFNPVGNLYKTWIWIMAQALGVPEVIIKRKPSAELVGNGQSDEEDMGISYAALDLLLYLIAGGNSDAVIADQYQYPPAVVAMVKNRIADNEHKSKAAPVCASGL